MDMRVQEHLVRIMILSPVGRIDAFSSGELRTRFEALLDSGAAHFVCDLTSVDFMDSAGLAALVSLLKRSRQAGGQVKLVRPTADGAKRILHLTKFDRVFDLYDNSADAVGSFVH